MKIAQILIFLTIFLSPLYILRNFFILPGLELYIPYTLLEVFILISVIVTSFYFIKGKYKLADLRTAFDPFIAVFLLAAIASLFTSYDLIGGMGIFKAYIIEPILFYYVIVFVSKKTNYSFVIWALIGVGLWLCILGLMQKFLGWFIFAPIEYEQNRITGVYNSANSLALFLGPLALLVFYYFIESVYTKPSKYLYLILFGLFIFVLYYTRSRGGIISLVGAMSVFTFAIITLKNKLIRRFWIVAPATVVVCLLAFFVFLYHNYDFFPIDYQNPYTAGDTLQIRYFIWAGTINMLKENFIFGAGLNGFKTLYSNQYRPVQYQEQFQYPHNILLTFWTEMGIFGLFAFLLLIVSFYSVLIRNFVKSHQPVLGAAFLAILSYWMLHGMVDVPYFKNDLSLEFWTIAALIEAWRLRG